jgi:ABC-type transport system involved in multi-copper enzyme maturation permease subunit
MTLLPVIERELRAESRHPLTYSLRVAGVTALLGAAVLFWLNGGFHTLQGERLFRVLHQTLFWSIWVLVPLLTADGISREKREGTIGLLFLTPLRARDIVLAKGLAQGLRALTVFVAALPVLVLPFLLGGVDWRVALNSALVNLNSFCWALGAGLLASSRNKTLTQSMSWAVLWAFLFFWVMVATCGVAFFSLISMMGPRSWRPWPGSIVNILGSGIFVSLGFFDFRGMFGRFPPAKIHEYWLLWCLGLGFLSVLLTDPLRDMLGRRA